jgi:hypothetical protein
MQHMLLPQHVVIAQCACALHCACLHASLKGCMRLNVCHEDAYTACCTSARQVYQCTPVLRLWSDGLFVLFLCRWLSNNGLRQLPDEVGNLPALESL